MLIAITIRLLTRQEWIGTGQIMMMRKEYRITPLNIIRALSPLIIALIFFASTLFHFYTMETDETDADKRLFWITMLWIVLCLYNVVYPLIIYWNHYSYDKDTLLIIDNQLDEFTYKKENIDIKMKVSDIRYAKSHHCSLRGYLMHYYALYLKEDTTPIIVTSLVAPNLLKKLPNTKSGSDSYYDMFI
jgi:hypothetical protein